MNYYSQIIWMHDFNFSDLSLMDWSAKNVIALAISSCVFLWNATDGSIEQIGHMVPEDDYVSSVAWCQQGSYLAVGRSNNTIQVRTGGNYER